MKIIAAIIVELCLFLLKYRLLSSSPFVTGLGSGSNDALLPLLYLSRLCAGAGNGLLTTSVLAAEAASPRLRGTLGVLVKKSKKNTFVNKERVCRKCDFFFEKIK